MLLPAVRNLVATALLTVLLSILACSSTDTSSDPAASATARPVSTLVPPAGITGQEILEQARNLLNNARSFEGTKQTVWQRRDSRTESELRGVVEDAGSAYAYGRNDSQVTEVIDKDGHWFVRDAFRTQAPTRWRQIQSSGEPPVIQQLRRSPDDLAGPRITGVEVSNETRFYVLQGAAPIPIAFGGRTEFEPGLYTLKVDFDSMASVSLTYSLVSWILDDQIPIDASLADITVRVEFSSINQPTVVDAPSEEDILRPDDATPTPDPRYPASLIPPV